MIDVVTTVLTIGFIALAAYVFVNDQRRDESRTEALAQWNKVAAGLSHRIAELEDERAEDYRAIVALRDEVATWKAGVVALTQQIKEMQMEPVWTAEKAGVPPTTAFDATRLRRQMQAHFNITELNDLALALGINSEDIEGDTISERAKALTEYVKRHDLVDALIKQARELRPRAKW